MRVAVFEMKFLSPALNPKIAIDEAVEVAKKYGSTDSGAFVKLQTAIEGVSNTPASSSVAIERREDESESFTTEIERGRDGSVCLSRADARS